MFKFLDKVANAGAGSRMPSGTLTRAKDQSVNTNVRNQLAAVAANPGASRVARKQAKAQLVNAVGEAKAEQLVEQAVHKARDSFRG
ncbi:hypothetical protein [Nonomuraea sp. NPDC049158]|uniref:hypothetical protein n=1 Tax=Nonomuraea sp. NPDC049158 TaxID=3155649 RepID=UPI003402A223